MVDFIDTLLISMAVKLKGSDGGNVKLPKADANATVETALNLVYFAASMMAVIIIIVAGILYATSGGNPERVKRAKNAILYSVIGLVVVALAFSITAFVMGRIG